MNTPNNEPPRIEVPKDGSVISYYILTPQADNPNWGLTVDPSNGQDVTQNTGGDPMASLEILFENKDPSLVQLNYERCVLVVSMKPVVGPGEENPWSFALNGVQVGFGSSDIERRVSSFITPNGQQLVAFISNAYGPNEEIHFRFVASYRDRATGQLAFYTSSDPKIIINAADPP